MAGTIDGDVKIKNDFITIAGQTAPGDGITIKGNLGIDANDVVIRYIRIRTDHDGDALGGRYQKNIIVDQVSASWSSDGYTNVEEYLNGTDPTEFVDHTNPENNINSLEKSHGK